MNDAIEFLNSVYPNKPWNFRETIGKVHFFDATIPVDGEEDDYEQIYLVKKATGWEFVIDEKYSSPYKQPYDLAHDVEHFSNDVVGVNNSIGFDQYKYRYYGSPSQEYVLQFKNKKQHFLQVVNDGMDCKLPAGQRSTFELSKQLNFDKVVNELHAMHENLLLNYFNYIAHRVCVLFDDVERASIYDAIVANDCNDSLTDMLLVLDKIKAATAQAGYTVKLHPRFMADVKNNLAELKQEIADTHQFTRLQKQKMNAVFKQLLDCIKEYK